MGLLSVRCALASEDVHVEVYNPERRLAFAVLFRAVSDIITPGECTNDLKAPAASVPYSIQRRARVWILSPSKRRGSFLWWSSMAARSQDDFNDIVERLRNIALQVLPMCPEEDLR